MQSTHIKTAIVLGLAALIAGAVLFRFIDREPGPITLESGTALGAQARSLPDFVLTDHHGARFDNSALQNHWSFLFFGYTHCPDICPTTLATLNQVIGGVQGDRNVQVVFVSVDPGRDTPEQLSEYVRYFNPAFIGTTGDPANLAKLTRSLGIVYTTLPGKVETSGDYDVDHSASILLIGPDGKLQAIFSPPLLPERIAADFLKLKERL